MEFRREPDKVDCWRKLVIAGSYGRCLLIIVFPHGIVFLPLWEEEDAT